MSVLNQLASAQNRRDEVPNQELAARLCGYDDLDTVQEAIQELVDNLKHKNKAIRSDCIKVLYEVGAIKPDLIEDYIDEFVALLSSKDNRMVWGGMTALGSIAPRRPQETWGHIDTIIDTTQNGSAITQDWGIRVLASLSSTNETYAIRIFPFLMSFLKSCKSKDAPRHAESIIVAANTASYQAQLRDILGHHQPNLKPNQLKRVEKLLRNL